MTSFIVSHKILQGMSSNLPELENGRVGKPGLVTRPTDWGYRIRCHEDLDFTRNQRVFNFAKLWFCCQLYSCGVHWKGLQITESRFPLKSRLYVVFRKQCKQLTWDYKRSSIRALVCIYMDLRIIAQTSIVACWACFSACRLLASLRTGFGFHSCAHSPKIYF